MPVWPPEILHEPPRVWIPLFEVCCLGHFRSLTCHSATSLYAYISFTCHKTYTFKYKSVGFSIFKILYHHHHLLQRPVLNRRASGVALLTKNPPASSGDVRDAGQIPGLGRSPGGGHGTPLQYGCLENPMDRGTGRLYSPQGHKESDTTEATHTAVLNSSHSSFLPTPSPWQPLIYVPMNLAILNILYKWNYMLCGPLCLTFPSQHYVFKAYLCCSMYQDFIPFYG